MEEIEKTPETKRSVIARYPLEYIWAMVTFTVTSMVGLLVVPCFAPSDEKAEITALFLGIATILTILTFGLKRYEITLNDEELCEVPIIGRKKQIKVAEIKNVKIKRSKAISVSSEKKKIYIDPAVTEYKQIADRLSERGLM